MSVFRLSGFSGLLLKNRNRVEAMRLLYSYIMVCLMVWILLVGKIVEGKINLSAAIAGGVVAVLAAPAMLGYLRRRAKKGEFNLSSSLPRWLFFSGRLYNMFCACNSSGGHNEYCGRIYDKGNCEPGLADICDCFWWSVYSDIIRWYFYT